MPEMPTPDPNVAQPTDLPMYTEAPDLGNRGDGQNFRHGRYPEDKVWVSDRVAADDRGDEASQWVMFNRFDVDFATPTMREWRPTGETTGEFKVVSLGGGRCIQQQQVEEREWTYSTGILLQYYEQWITDLKLEWYYDKATGTGMKSTVLGGTLAARFGQVAATRAATAAAATAAAEGTVAAGATATAGTVAAGAGVAAVTFVGTFALTSALMREIKNEVRVGSSGWAPIGKWKTDEVATEKTRMVWRDVGSSYPCAAGRVRTGGKRTAVLVGVGATTVAVGVGVGIVQSGDGGESAPPVTAAVASTEPTPTEAPASAASGSTAPATSAPATTNAPTTVPPSTVPASTVPPVATRFGISSPCGVTAHSPHASSPGSPSHFIVSAVLAGIDGVLAGIDQVTVRAPAADVAEVVAPLIGDGLIQDAVFPISSFGDYQVVIEVDGTPAETLEPFVVSVGPDEGPVAGCTPGGELTAEQISAAASSWSIVVSDEEAVPAPEDDLGPYREFFARYETAHRDGDTDFLLDTLHPLTIDRYGIEQCTTYVESVVGSVAGLRVVDGVSEPWDYPGDGRSSDVPDAFTLTIDGEFGGVEQTAEIHVARVDEDLAWFADCGDPVP